MGFFEILRKRAQKCNSLLCVGIDPHVAQLPEPSAAAAEKFSLDLINATAEFAAAFKPNAAFFEVFGAQGMDALERVIAAVPEGIPVVLDAKKGDISTTAAAYATAAFDTLKAHCVTLAPYMGRDSIDPFVGTDASRGCFVLCKTSNASSNELQTCQCDGDQMVFEKVALLAKSWNRNDNIGLVVGATDVNALSSVRSIVPKIWILAPGIGAQGGNLSAAVEAGIDADGMGLLLSISRGISEASDPAEAARRLRDEINTAKGNARKRLRKSGRHVAKKFIRFTLECNVLRFGNFTLKSGRSSPYFFNAGLFCTGKTLATLATFYALTIHESGLNFDVLYGPAYKGITLAAAVSMAMYQKYGRDVPYAYNRKEAKDHGEGGLLVGADVSGKRVLLVDDVITAGTAIGEAVGLLRATKATVVGVVISLDRQEKGLSGEQSAVQEAAEMHQMQILSVARLQDLIEYLEENESEKEHLDRIKKHKREYAV